MSKHDNPKHRQADGAGFGRLRAAQALRMQFAALLKTPLSDAYIDQIREYCGTQVVFYRRMRETSEQARVAVFIPSDNGGYTLSHNMIVAQQHDT